MIEKFKEIFSGLDRAHGVYKKGDTQNGVKQKGKAFIKKEPVTDELWQKHLDGEESLGIIPVRDAIKDLDGEIITPSTCSCLLYTSPSPRDLSTSRMPSSA